MADLSHVERGTNARSAYGKRKSSDADAKTIADVLKNMDGRKEMDVCLAIGAACPYAKEQKREREAWVAEANRQIEAKKVSIETPEVAHGES